MRARRSRYLTHSIPVTATVLGTSRRGNVVSSDHACLSPCPQTSHLIVWSFQVGFNVKFHQVAGLSWIAPVSDGDIAKE